MSIVRSAGHPARRADDGAAASLGSDRRSSGRAWLLAATSLVLAGNLAFSRHLLSDSYYDLYAGRYIAAHGLPRRNVVTWASHGARWIDQQWLAHLAYYLAWEFGGYPLLATLSAALISAGFGVLALLMLRRGVPPERMFAWTLVAFVVSLGELGIRAQSFGYLFFALTLWLIVTDGQQAWPGRRTWLLVPVTAVWANTHGSVVLGAGLAVAYCGYRAARALARRSGLAAAAHLALAAAVAAAVLATPYGVGVLGYYRDLIGNSEIARFVGEWAPPLIDSPLSWPAFALAATVVVVIAIAWRRGCRPEPVLAGLALVPFAGMLIAARNEPWFGLTGSLLAADLLARARADRGAPELGGVFRRALAAVLAVVALASLGVIASTPTRVYQAGAPVQAINVAAAEAAANPGARVLADWSAAPMLWLHPMLFGRVGFDARLEQYTPTELASYVRFLLATAPRWQSLARGYGIVVVTRHNYPTLARAMRRLPGWRLSYADGDGEVFVRVTLRPTTGG